MSERHGETYTHPSLPLFLVPGVIKGTDYFPTKAVQNTRRSEWGENSRINLHPHLSPAPPGKGGGWREYEGGRKDRKGRDHQLPGSPYHWLPHVPPRPETPARFSVRLPNPSPHHPKPRGPQSPGCPMGSPALALWRPDQGLEVGGLPVRWADPKSAPGTSQVTTQEDKSEGGV